MRPTKSNSLREVRLKRGLSQDALAAQTGVSQSAIAMYESGMRKVNLEVSDTLAKALGVNEGDFLAFYTSMLEAADALDLPPRPPKAVVQQVHLDTIDLMDALGNVLGEKTRDDLLGESLSGVGAALRQALKLRLDAGGELDPRVPFFRLWLERLEASDSDLGFASLSEIQRVRAAARARWFDYLRHGE
jgi:transcriptional regulator with XRE-family HTH domain